MSSKLIFTTLSVVFLLGLLANCRQNTLLPDPVDPEPELPPGTTYLAPSPQRPGDPVAGYEYLIYGDYISSGIPFGVYKQIFGTANPDDLGRAGDNDGISFRFNIVAAANGVKVAAPTCLTCHAEKINGQLIVGLGNNTSDNTTDQGASFQSAAQLINLYYGPNSPEAAAFQPISRGTQAIGAYVLTKVRGVNPADKIFGTLSAHRKSDDLSWLADKQFDVPIELAPTDVPAWWHVKKKHALYYNGLGRGDFARLSTASGLLTMLDSAEARVIDNHFPDVMAWIRTLEAPAYPYTVNQTLAAQGKTVFGQNCAKCHGVYGSYETYPNLLVNLATIGTDPLLSEVYQTHPEHHTWYNGSWFAQGPYKAELLPNDGYVAPPLDGIWATAPYLHNGSVPTLEDLLNSPQRPVFWKRTFDNSDFNQVKVGWNYSVESAQATVDTYDTTLPGYGKSGHTFGDVLSAAQRSALIEYLKTL